VSGDVVSIIREYGIKAELLVFNDTVESVSKASKLTNEPSSRIIKTLLIKASGDYVITVVRGDRRVDLRKLAEYLKCDVRMAGYDEVLNVLGVPPGAVTPISRRVLSLRRILDPKILSEPYVICGGGTLNSLIKLGTEDLIKFLKPEVVDVFK